MVTTEYSIHIKIADGMVIMFNITRDIIFSIIHQSIEYQTTHNPCY